MADKQYKTDKWVHFWNAFLRDKRGKVVVWQFPNAFLWGWIGCTLLGMLFVHGRTHSVLHSLAELSLLVWAALEIFSGASWFRRILGAVVLFWALFGFLR